MKSKYKKYPSYKDSGVEWLGKIPEHWKVGRIKNSAMIFNGATPKSGVKEYWDGDISWIGPADMGKITTRDIFSGARDITSNGYNSCGTMLVPKDSVILSSRAPIGKVAIAGQELCTNQGCKSLVINQHFSNIFIFYILISNTKQLNLLGRGTTFLELSAEELASFNIPILPLQEQKTIANYLDRATAKIDTLIAKQSRLIELLREKRQALISTAVTRGLNPDVPMKDSGVEWLGEIPEGWEVKKTKNIFSLIVEPAHINNKYELLSIYTDIGVKPRKDLEQKGNKATTTDGYWKVQKKDIIVNKLLAWMGAIGISNYDGVTSPAYDILRPKKDISSDFYHLLFRTKKAQTEFKKCSRGIMEMRLRLYFSEFGQIKMPMPPYYEQLEIIEKVTDKTQKIDILITKATQAIELLKERRTALISAVVTGKIDVRETYVEGDV